MFWEELTASEFEIACEKTKRTCLLPVGVIEKHGNHLPLGTDMYSARALAGNVAELEPVVIFPYYFYGQITEARHCPGTIAIRPELMYSLLEETCNEISRNGFKKIVLLDTHGGDFFFLRYFAQSLLNTPRDYAVFIIKPPYDEAFDQKIMQMMGTDELGEHAGNKETSSMMAIRPDLVKLEQAEPEGVKRRGLLDHIDKNIFTPIYWYADHPTHQAGDPSKALTEVGTMSHAHVVEKMAEIIRQIKEDQVTIRLQNEFYAKCRR